MGLRVSADTVLGTEYPFDAGAAREKDFESRCERAGDGSWIHEEPDAFSREAPA